MNPHTHSKEGTGGMNMVRWGGAQETATFPLSGRARENFREEVIIAARGHKTEDMEQAS